ncbi:tripartite tricarboxylate transporter TctB family protein [Notoacmeibacter sp. MSK16QG-6]|uniref:tripartite tricarboxylate transporter TctB family protein n=1 Tax=Notoacmeibacter sp. MSK16QG-6 TaxID=2957982 RepID=UPI00209F7DDC|nr:tripartite tricarboxylate transporter TctB family protein [Notoacmeibacter sp. MSK16QG-6]MCP1199572.1 tripartite tricarboxylate transporter TctB family protein [Notoacmeibacter sp. MSK16QG-6]
MSHSRQVKPADLVASVVFAALAVFVAIQPFLSGEPRLSPGDPGPWLLPLIYGAGLIVLSAALFLRGLRPAPLGADVLQIVEEYNNADGDEAADVESPDNPADQERAMLPRLLAVAMLCIVYVWSFEHLGFYIATGVFLFLSIVALGTRGIRDIVVAIIVAAATTATVGLVLTHLLEVSLPVGDLL